jgi:MFS family permease
MSSTALGGDATSRGEARVEAGQGRLALYLPHALIFFSSACIMVVELVAGRMIARHLGSSLYTWTSIIGVVLAGMSVGNMVGGRLADRRPPRAYLGLLFMAGSIACLLALYLNALFTGHPLLAGQSWPLRVFVTVVVIFFLPAVVLGTIAPATAKMAIERSRSLGRTIGSVYAWGAVGSIVGTLGTGFWLIALLGVHGVVLVTAASLALVGVLLGPQRWAQLLWLVVLLGLITVSCVPAAPAVKLTKAFGLRDNLDGDFTFFKDSHYQFVKVYRQKVKRAPALGKRQPPREVLVLALDHLVHGYIDPKDPTYLHYGYERVYRDAARDFVGDRRKVSAFFIGGGAYTFPRLVQHLWPGSRIDVAEIDPMVVEANHVALGLPRDTPIRTIALDGRNAVADLPASRRYDLIFGDAFNDLSIPAHLITLEFTEELAEHLAPDGAYLVNVIDDFQVGKLLCAFVSTMEQVFPHVYVFSTSRYGAAAGRETFVVAGSRRALPTVASWTAGHSTSREGSLLTAAERKTLRSRCGGRVLTDTDAPVENLIAPVVQKKRN